MESVLVPLKIPAGYFKNGTLYQSQGRWQDGSLVRFFEQMIRPVGGWTPKVDLNGIPLGTLSGFPNGARAYRDVNNNPVVAFGTTTNWYVFLEGTLYDITPAGFAGGSAVPTIGNAPVSYGSGLYGRGLYGVNTVGTFQLDPDVTVFDNFGGLLVGVASQNGVLYIWEGDPTVPAIPAPNAPSCNAVCVSPEQFVVALGSNGDVRQVAWGDQSSFSVWVYDPLNPNQAGTFQLPSAGQIMCGSRTRGGTLIWTDADLWGMQYTTATLDGVQLVYAFTQLGDQCGIVARNAYAMVDASAFWMGRNGFYTYTPGGAVTPIPCEVQDYVFPALKEDYLSQVWAIAQPDFGEVWWFYPIDQTQTPVVVAPPPPVVTGAVSLPVNFTSFGTELQALGGAGSTDPNGDGGAGLNAIGIRMHFQVDVLINAPAAPAIACLLSNEGTTDYLTTFTARAIYYSVTSPGVITFAAFNYVTDGYVTLGTVNIGDLPAAGTWIVAGFDVDFLGATSRIFIKNDDNSDILPLWTYTGAPLTASAPADTIAWVGCSNTGLSTVNPAIVVDGVEIVTHTFGDDMVGIPLDTDAERPLLTKFDDGTTTDATTGAQMAYDGSFSSLPPFVTGSTWGSVVADTPVSTVIPGSGGANSQLLRYVVYNCRENHWTTGDLVRACGVPTGVIPNPVMVDPTNNVIYDHEVGTSHLANDEATILPLYLASGPVEIGSGDLQGYGSAHRGDTVLKLLRFLPDMVDSVSNPSSDPQAALELSFLTTFYPTDVPTSFGPYALTMPTDIRITCREFVFRFDQVLESDWRIGNLKIGLKPGGKR